MSNNQKHRAPGIAERVMLCGQPASVATYLLTTKLANAFEALSSSAAICVDSSPKQLSADIGGRRAHLRRHRDGEAR